MFARFRRAFFIICLVRLQYADAQSFEVASIRPHLPDDARFGIKMPTAGRFSATGSTAKLLMMIAYDVQETQIVDGPSWIASEKWDIAAKSDDQTQYSHEETRRMLQNLIEERFALHIRRETRQLPAYVLTIANGGPKFKAVKQPGPNNVQFTGNLISLASGELARLTQLLSGALGRPVVDRTGLTDRYDLSLQWDDSPIAEGGVLGADVRATPGNNHGSIFTAIQDQLGLRLESQRAPVEVIVVDRMERPSAN